MSPIADAAPRSAPEADVAHGLAGGATLCRREVDLAAGADAHLVDSLFLGSLSRRRRVDAERETPQLNGVGVKKYLGGKISRGMLEVIQITSPEVP